MSAPTTTYQMELDKRDTALILAALHNASHDQWEDNPDYAKTVENLRGRIVGTSTEHYRGANA